MAAVVFSFISYDELEPIIRKDLTVTLILKHYEQAQRI